MRQLLATLSVLFALPAAGRETVLPLLDQYAALASKIG